MSVEFWVDGVRGQGRPRFARGRAYKAAADRAYEDGVAAAYLGAGGAVHAGPVEVEVHAYAPLPKGRPARVASEPWTCRPDADNVAKAVLDALNGVAWRDDSQVVSLTVRKHDRERGRAGGLAVTVRPCGGAGRSSG